jgi:hypothetical protein
MASLQIKILVSMMAISVIYAFVCEIRLTRRAGELRKRITQERPELWSELNLFARNWNGGYAGLKVLYRENALDFQEFKEEYEQLRDLERKLLLGIGIGSACIALVIVGSRFLGWQW